MGDGFWRLLEETTNYKQLNIIEHMAARQNYYTKAPPGMPGSQGIRQVLRRISISVNKNGQEISESPGSGVSGRQDLRPLWTLYRTPFCTVGPFGPSTVGPFGPFGPSTVNPFGPSTVGPSTGDPFGPYVMESPSTILLPFIR